MITSTFCCFSVFRYGALVSAVRGDVKIATRVNWPRADRMAFKMNEPIWPVAPKTRIFWGTMVSWYVEEEEGEQGEVCLCTSDL